MKRIIRNFAFPSSLEHPIAPQSAAGYAREMTKPVFNLLSPLSTVRAVRQLVPVLACCGVLGLLAGCSTEPDSHLVSAPPPPAPTNAVTTTTTTSTTPVAVSAPGTVVSTTVVTQAPPALQSEVVLAQPSPQHVWIAGYWTWQNDRYEWMAGHWELPPNSASVWVAPRWEQQGASYRFYEGYWN
jgi:hypothetical protein